MDVNSKNKNAVSHIAKQTSHYIWLTSGFMLMGVFYAIYKDTLENVPHLNLSLGGCLVPETDDLKDISLTGEAKLSYSDEYYLPVSADATFYTSDILNQLDAGVHIDKACLEDVTHPFADAIKYSAIVAVLTSAVVLSTELITQKFYIAKLLSTYTWILAGCLVIGVFDAFYDNTLNQIPNLDLSFGGCFKADVGNIPKTISPDIVSISYNTTFFRPETVTVTLTPLRALDGYSPNLYFDSECVKQITSPFAQALKVSFFIGLGLSFAIFSLEQLWRNDFFLKKITKESKDEIENSPLDDTLHSKYEKTRTDSEESEGIELSPIHSIV